MVPIEDNPLQPRQVSSVRGILAFVLIMTMAIFAPLAHAEKDRLIITAGGQGGNYLGIAKILAEHLRQNLQGVEVEVRESSGSVENARRLEAGEADLGLLQNDTPANNSLRSLAPLYEEVLHVLARKDANVTTIEDLRGKRMAVGSKGSGTAPLVKELLAYHGLEYENIEPAFLSTSDAAGKLVEGKLDAMAFISGVGSQVCRKAVESGQISFVSIGKTDLQGGQVAGFRYRYPYAYPVIIPAMAYPSSVEGVSGEPLEPVATVAVEAVLCCRKDLPESVAREVVAAIFENQAGMARQKTLFAQARSPMSGPSMQFPLHSGAEAYYRRDEPGFLVRYAELMSLVVSCAVAIWGFAFAIRQIINRRKKNKIDEYYLILDKMIQELSNPEVSSDRALELSVKVDHIRETTLAMLVREELAADEAFLILQRLMQECKGLAMEKAK